MIKKITICSLLIMLIFCVPVYAGAPMTAVEATVNRVLDVLRDPKLKGPSAKQAKAEKLRVIYKDMFDEMEFSKTHAPAQLDQVYTRSAQRIC